MFGVLQLSANTECEKKKQNQPTHKERDSLEKSLVR
jgi:hypothetical protein